MDKVLDKVREMLCTELEEISKAGKLDATNLEHVDKLTHSIKSIDTIIAMEDAGYSQEGGSYNGQSYAGGSYARGGRRRDSMGRYTRNGYSGRSYGGGSYRGGSYAGGYSRDDGRDMMMEQLERAMSEAPTERSREAIRMAMEQLDAE